jgi:hypothetical protein
MKESASASVGIAVPHDTNRMLVIQLRRSTRHDVVAAQRERPTRRGPARPRREGVSVRPTRLDARMRLAPNPARSTAARVFRGRGALQFGLALLSQQRVPPARLLALALHAAGNVK